MSRLQSFWITHEVPNHKPFFIGFGVTGYSLADALDLLVWAGFKWRTDIGELRVLALKNGAADLFASHGTARHAEYNCGPIPCRGVWYPWIAARPPNAQGSRMDQSLSLPPAEKLAACLAALEAAALRLRLIGYSGERDGLPPATASEIAALADAVHNLPYLIQHWDRCDEKLLRLMLEDCDTRYPHALLLLPAYERAEARHRKPT